MTFLHLVLFASDPAAACGGMFCNAIQPVDQAAERIFFFYDQGRVTTEVQIAFEGEADEFAWVVPVPGEPTVEVSNDAMFTTLANQTTPVFQLGVDRPGSIGCAAEMAMSADMAPREDGGGVTVVSEEAVGPYLSVVLQAENADVLVIWLEDNGYSLPDGLDAVLQPYVAAGQYFVALKLLSDKDAGDIAPIVMSYTAEAASIPIQLTAVAAVADMPIEVFVFGPSRAVPDNYLHVDINEAAINWYEGADNYREVVSAAVDEAGGLAFATDYAGPATDFSGLLDWTDRFSPDALREADPVSWLETIVYSGMPGSTQLTNLLLELVPPPDGVDGATFLQCPGCYEVEVEDWDAVVATDRFETEILEVMAEQQARIDGAAWGTRLFTTMDPAEMTADPVFVFNDAVEQTVLATRSATSQERTNAFSGNVVSRTLILGDGREIVVPDGGEDVTAVREELGTPAAVRITDLSASGEGEVLFEHDVQADADAFNAGCSGEASALLAPAVLVLAAAARRRRA